MPKTAILYARVSTEEQARSGYSLAQQLEALRAWAALEGYTVPNGYEITDSGYSGAYLERPGLDRVRDLVDDGGITAVVAQDRDRLAREPALLWFLRKEFEAHGTTLRALNDRGDDSPEGQLTDGILDQLAKFERANLVRRSWRGKVRKAREGKVVAATGNKYGFKYNDAKDGYLVDEDAMPVVRRIYHMVGVLGYGINRVTNVLEAEGVSAPKGGRRWSRSFVRDLIHPDRNGDMYKPHTHEEVAALVATEVADRLDKNAAYGLWYFGRSAVTATRQIKTPNGYKKRTTQTPKPRNEWVAVPIPDAGIPLDLLEAARAAVVDNYKPKSNGKRFYELTGGLALCDACGGYMTGWSTTPRRGGKTHFYYVCRDSKAAHADRCTNRKAHRADVLESKVAQFVGGLLKNPGRLLKHLDEQIGFERRSLKRGNFEAQVKLWTERLNALDAKRSEYIDMAAEKIITRDDLRQKLDGIEEQRVIVRTELDDAAGRNERLRELEEDREKMRAAATGGADHRNLEDIYPADRRDVYRRLYVQVRAAADGDVSIIFSYAPETAAATDTQPGRILATPHGTAERVTWADVVSQDKYNDVSSDTLRPA